MTTETNQPKPKRKFVMTPERLAKIMANLAQARLAPKEKVYRRTEKRYAANLKNLGIGRAKRQEEARQEAETLRARMESAFPLDPDLRPPGGEPSSSASQKRHHDSRNSSKKSHGKREAGLSEPRASASGPRREAVPGSAATTTPGSSAPPSAGVKGGKPGTDAHDRGENPEKSGRDARAPGTDELDKITGLVGERLRQVKYGRRREGRRIMRVLTEALNMPHPLYPFQVADLARDLLHCLDPDRLTEEVRRLNNRIARLLLKMIEARYGPEPLSEWEERGLRLLEELRKLSAEEAGPGTRDSGPAEEPGPGTRDSGLADEASVVRPPSSVPEQAPVDATVAGQGEVSSAADDVPRTTDPSSANPESPTPDPGSSANPESPAPDPGRSEPRQVTTPPLPATEPELRELLARALDLDADDAEDLSSSIWERLQAWEPRHQQESEEVEKFFRDAAANAPAGDHRARYAYRQDLASRLPTVLELEFDFRFHVDSLTATVQVKLDCCHRKVVRAATKSQSDPPPAKPVKGGDESEEPSSGSEGAAVA